MKTPLTAASTAGCRELPWPCQTSVPEKSRLIFPGESPVGYYGLSLAKNSVMVERLGPALANARVFTEFEYQTVKSWSRSRRVIGKAEVTAQGPNPRFVVTNLSAEEFPEQEDKNDFAELQIQDDQPAQFVRERGEKLALWWWKSVVRSDMKDRRAARLSVQTNQK